MSRAVSSGGTSPRPVANATNVSYQLHGDSLILLVDLRNSMDHCLIATCRHGQVSNLPLSLTLDIRSVSALLRGKTSNFARLPVPAETALGDYTSLMFDGCVLQIILDCSAFPEMIRSAPGPDLVQLEKIDRGKFGNFFIISLNVTAVGQDEWPVIGSSGPSPRGSLQMSADSGMCMPRLSRKLFERSRSTAPVATLSDTYDDESVVWCGQNEEVFVDARDARGVLLKFFPSRCFGNYVSVTHTIFDSVCLELIAKTCNEDTDSFDDFPDIMSDDTYGASKKSRNRIDGPCVNVVVQTELAEDPSEDFVLIRFDAEQSHDPIALGICGAVEGQDLEGTGGVTYLVANCSNVVRCGWDISFTAAKAEVLLPSLLEVYGTVCDYLRDQKVYLEQLSMKAVRDHVLNEYSYVSQSGQHEKIRMLMDRAWEATRQYVCEHIALQMNAVFA